MNRLTKTYLIWPLCLLFVAGLTIGGNGSVVCVGDDGLVKVESVCEPCVDEAGEACRVEQVDVEHDHQDECVNCTDLPVDQNSISTLPNIQTSEVSYVYKVSESRLVTPVDTHIGLKLSEPPRPDEELPSARLFLSTIILRC